MTGAIVISDDLVLSFQDIDIKIIRQSLFLEREDWSSDFHRLGAFFSSGGPWQVDFCGCWNVHKPVPVQQKDSEKFPLY